MEWTREKKYRIVVAVVEILLLLCCILDFIMPRKNWEIEPINYQAESGIYMEEFLGEEGGYYIDNSMEYDGKSITTVPVTLPRGSYRITMHYKTEESGQTYWFTSENELDIPIWDRQVEGLDAEKDSMTVPLDTNYEIENFQISFQYGGNNYLLVQNVSIEQTRKQERVQLFGAILIIILLEICIKVRKDMWWSSLPTEKKICFLSLVGIVLLASIPLWNDYIYTGHDLQFHLIRIEGIRQGLLDGQFPVRMQPAWLNGKGYAAGIFYGDTLLYIPAFLRLIGFSLPMAYKSYIFLMNVATAFISWICFRKIFGKNYAALLSAALYTLAPYRLSCIYIRAAVGEYTALLFYPIIFYGLYQIFTKDTGEDSYKKCWLIPAIGYAGLIQSHIISCEMAAVFTIMTCLFMWKKVIQPKRFLELVKTVAGMILFSLWFLIPFLDYMRDNLQVKQTSDFAGLQKRAAFLSELFSPFFMGQGVSDNIYDRVGKTGNLSYAIGLPLLLAGILFLVYYLVSKEKENSRVQRLGVFSLVGAIIAIFMCSNCFPYDKLASLNEGLEFAVKNLQFPWRFEGMAGLFLAVCGGCFLCVFEKKKYCKENAIMVCLVTMLAVGMFISNLVYTNNTQVIRNENDLGYTGIGAAEYLLEGTDQDKILKMSSPEGENIQIDSYEKEYTNVKITCHNLSSNENKVEIPLLYYRGYKAQNLQTQQDMKISMGEYGAVAVTLPGNFQGEIEVYFQSFWYWHLAEAVTLLFVIFLFVRLFKGKIKILHREA